MGRMCAVPRCGNRMKKTSPHSFHKLPLHDRDRLPLWLLAIGLDADTPLQTLRGADHRVCSEHFDRSDYFQPHKGRKTPPKHFHLNRAAVPTVRPKEEAPWMEPSDEGGSSITFDISEITFGCDEEAFSDIGREEEELQKEDEEEEEEEEGEEEEEEEEMGYNKYGSDPDWENDDIESNSESDWDEEAHMDSKSNQDDISFNQKFRQLCPECGMFFHTVKTHTCEYKIKPFACIDCGKRCVNENALKIHCSIHKDSYKHLCKFCLAIFKTKSDKLAHEPTHFSEKNPYKCSDCPISFPKLKARNLHLKTHRGPQKFKCPTCNLEFKKLYKLNRHTVVHTGDKPFVCDVCKRSFNQASHLKSHMRLHTGERPFQCQDCDESFNHKVSLKSHVMRYHSKVYGSGQDGQVEETKMKPPEVKKEVLNQKESRTEDVEKKGGMPEFDRLEGLEKRTDTKKDKTSLSRSRGRPKRNARVTDQNLVLAKKEPSWLPGAGETFQMDDLERIACNDDKSRRKDGDLTLGIKEETTTCKRKTLETPTWGEEEAYGSHSDYPVEKKMRKECQPSELG